MSRFKQLFEEYGFTVEEFGKSYIAHNAVFCVPYTEVGEERFPEISAISFSVADLDDIKNHYANEEYIGCKVFHDFMNHHLKFRHVGGILNHDHSLYEVELWLKTISKSKNRTEV